MEFRVLGPVEIGPVGAPVALRGHRRRGVLAVLLLRANQVVSTTELVQTLWAEPTMAAESNVRTQVTAIRRLFDEPGRLTTEASGYRLAVRPGELDLAVFEDLAADGEQALRQGAAAQALEQLDRARRLWRGPALDGVSSSIALTAEATRLEQRRIAVTELWAEAAIAAGRPGGTVADLRALVSADPLRERTTGLLMTALVEAGEPAAALTAYQQLRETLAEQLGTDPAPEIQRLHEQILRGEPVRQQAEPKVTPRQLPAEPAGFTGRQAELDALTRLLNGNRGTVVISAIGGMAGVGKTALAVRWAHRVADRFSDGQLYVDLRGFAPSGARPADPGEALRGFLDAFGVPPDRIPAGEDAQAAFYRSLVADKRLLILLDNARDEQQVRPLLPGSPGCLVLVTSRHRLTGLVSADGATPLALDLLTDAEAGELLARRLGDIRTRREPAAAAELVALCARLPLALAIVAAHAAERPDLDLASLADQLRGGHDRLDALDSGDVATDPRSVFSWSYRALSAAAARLFRLLGLHPGPDVSAEAAASLAALPLAETRRTLKELVGANLATERVPGRYGFHDLLRAYAAELTADIDTEPDRQAATHRMLDHYLHTAYTAAMLLYPGRDPIALGAPEPGTRPEVPTTADQAMAWFAQERHVLLAVVEYAVAVAAHTYTWQLAWTLIDFLDRQSHWDDWVTTQQAAVAAASRLGDPSVGALTHTSLANVYIRRHRLDEAQPHLERALELAVRAGNQVRQAYAHLNMSGVWGRRQRADLSLEHNQQALDLFRRAGDRNGEAQALNGVGWCHGVLGRYEQTLSYCTQALALQQELDDHAMQANTWDSLGYAHHHLGNHQQALTSYQHALSLYQQFGNRCRQAQVLVCIGDTHHAMGCTRAACAAWQRAGQIFTDIGHADADAVRTRLAALGRADPRGGAGQAG